MIAEGLAYGSGGALSSTINSDLVDVDANLAIVTQAQQNNLNSTGGVAGAIPAHPMMQMTYFNNQITTSDHGFEGRVNS